MSVAPRHLDADEAQEMQEHVEEVEVETQRAEDDSPRRVSAPLLEIYLLEHLHVVGDEAREQQYRETADGVVERRRLEEDAHDERDEEADQRRQKESPEAGEISFGRVAPQRAPSEHRRSDEEDAQDALARVRVEHRCEGHAVESGEDREDDRRRGCAELRSQAHPRQEDHHRQLDDSSGEPEPRHRVARLLLAGRIDVVRQTEEIGHHLLVACDVHRDRAGDGESDTHRKENA